MKKVMMIALLSIQGQAAFGEEVLNLSCFNTGKNYYGIAQIRQDQDSSPVLYGYVTDNYIQGHLICMRDHGRGASFHCSGLYTANDPVQMRITKDEGTGRYQMDLKRSRYYFGGETLVSVACEPRR